MPVKQKISWENPKLPKHISMRLGDPAYYNPKEILICWITFEITGNEKAKLALNDLCHFILKNSLILDFSSVYGILILSKILE